MDELGLGLIGFGFIGKTHYKNAVNNPACRVAAVFSYKRGKKEIGNDIKFYTDWKELIEKEDIDAVIIATPTNTHGEIAEFAATHKKHIFLEKPMERTVEKCANIIETAEKEGVILFPAHVLRYWPAYAAVYDIIKEEKVKLGRFIGGTLMRVGGFPGWSGWFADFSVSGGVILDLSIHDIDYGVYLFGIPDSIESEYLEVDKGYGPLPVESKTKLRYGDAELICIASWNSEGFTAKGSLEFENGKLKFSGDSRKITLTIDGEKRIIEAAPSKYPEGYYAELDEFIAAVREGITPRVTPEDGLTAVRLCLEAYKNGKKKSD